MPPSGGRITEARSERLWSYDAAGVGTIFCNGALTEQPLRSIVMATGWAREGAVQDQIDDTVKDGVARAKSQLPQGPSATHCRECAEPITGRCHCGLTQLRRH